MISFIRIDKPEQEFEGIDELSAHTRVTVYRGGILCVPTDKLCHLERLDIAYSDVPADEVEAALASFRERFRQKVESSSGV